MIKIDEENRRIIITNEKTRDINIINEFDKIEKVFLLGTEDKYECELVLLEVPIYDENTKEKTDKVETKAFARRVGQNYMNWLETLNETDFILNNQAI